MARIDTTLVPPGWSLSPPAPLVPLPPGQTNPGNLRGFGHRPLGLPPGAPLVVVLHGGGQSAQDYAIGAGWVALADRFGFALLCPQQQRANNPGLCFNWFQPGDTARGQGEAASIAQMIADTLAAWALDPGAVFVTGLSAGGAMAAALLASYPDRFAAGAVVAGLPYGVASTMGEAFSLMSQGTAHAPGSLGARVRAATAHPGPWPRLSIWQGARDSVVRPGAANDLARQWTELHGLDGAPQPRATGPDHSTQVWHGPDGRGLVELHLLGALGHGAPIQPGGADGHGHPGPWLIDVGVSAAIGAARFWGLAPALHPA